MICIAFSTALFLIHSPVPISKMDNTNYVEQTHTNSTEKVASPYNTTESKETTVQKAETAVKKDKSLNSANPTFMNLSSQTSRGTERDLSTMTKATNTNDKVEAFSTSGNEKIDLNKDQSPVSDDSNEPKSSDSPSVAPSEKEIAADEKVSNTDAKEVTSDVKNDTSDDGTIDLLARLICAEAQGEPYEAKVAVGAVVINRVQSGAWAPTISDVIYQNINGYYQFTPVENGWINKPADSDSIKAAKAALRGDDPTNGAQFYYDDKATNTWILSKPVSVQIGHMFYAFE